MPGPGTWSPGDILTADDLNAIGVWSSYTPVLTQNGTRSATVNYAEFCVINKICFVNVDLTCTTTGSAGQVISVTLPVTGVSSGSIGSGLFFDSSASSNRVLSVGVGTTAVAFVSDNGTDNFGVNPSVALGNNDVISFSVMYEVV